MQWLTQRTPTVDKGHLYAVSSLGDLVCLQTADGRAYVRDSTGVVKLLLATPDGLAEKGKFTLPDVQPASGATLPVIAGGRL